MQPQRTESRTPSGRSLTWEFLTPLNAVSVWTLIVAAGDVWPPLMPLAQKLAFAGGIIVFTLALHLLHEAGHVLAGAVVGLPLRALTVGLLTVRREHDGARWRLRWDVNASWRRFAGCVEREISPAPGLRRAMTITALGGPAASLLVGALLLAAPRPWNGLGWVSIMVGLFNALPSAVMGQLSDGMIVYRLWSRSPTAVAWRAPFCETEGESIAT